MQRLLTVPVYGGKLKSVDKTQAMKMKGVIDVVEIAPIKHAFSSLGAVAVVADNTWTAQQAVKKLKVEWDLGPNKDYDTNVYKAQLVKNVENPATLATERGDIQKAFESASKTLKATYTGGHLSHSPMEPNASVVWVQDDSCEVWASTQSPDDIQQVLGLFLGRDPKDVRVNVMMAGGAFGRKFKCDYVHEAAAISKQIKAPVQLIWSREEDMTTGYYHSINAQHVEASLDENNNVTGWLHRAAFPSINTLWQPDMERAPAANNLSQILITHPYRYLKTIVVKQVMRKLILALAGIRAVYAIFYGFALRVLSVMSWLMLRIWIPLKFLNPNLR